MPCGWEGNRGSGDALHGHASQISVVYPVAAHGLRKGDEHPATRIALPFLQERCNVVHTGLLDPSWQRGWLRVN